MEHYIKSYFTKSVLSNVQTVNTKKLPRWNITCQSEQLTRTFAVLVSEDIFYYDSANLSDQEVH